MDKTIENIWDNGFANNSFIVPTIEKLYNRKSISYVEKIITAFKWEVYILIPVTGLIFIFNILLGNAHAIFWSVVSSIPGLIWFFIGKSQLKSLMKLDYQFSSYDYLISIRKKFLSIRKFNRNIAITSVPLLLFPMILYTYFNQEGKTIGEIFDIEGFNYPTITLFLLLPIITLLIVIIAQLHYKTVALKTTKNIDVLITEIEELQE